MDNDNEPAPLIRNRYRVMQSVGAGGLGCVYYAWDEELQRTVAVKRLFSRAHDASPALEEAWQEARTLAALQNPHILTLFDFGSDEQGPYFIMEYLEGETLEAVLERGPMSLNEVVEMTRQVLEGLSAAHGKGIRHLDMKPSNLMVQRSASGKLHFKILDFGLARFQQQIDAQTADRSATGVMGTVYYISPEHLESGALGGYTDLYALGHVIYQALRGRPAYVGTSVEEVVDHHLKSEPEEIREFRPDVSPPLAAWLHRLMRRDPLERPQDATQALLELRKLDTLNLTASRPVFAASVEQPPDRSDLWLWVGGGVTAVLLAGAALGWYFSHRNTPAPPQVPAVAAKPPVRPSEVAPTPVPAEVAPPEPAVSAPTVPTPPSKEEVPAGRVVFAPEDLGGLRQRMGQEVVVRGIPVKAGKNKDDKVRYVNFTEDFSRSISLVFFVEDQPGDFALEKLESFIGKSLEVRGTVQEYRGALQIRIRALDQIHLP